MTIPRDEIPVLVARMIERGLAHRPTVHEVDHVREKQLEKQRECMKRLREKRRSLGLTAKGTPVILKQKPFSEWNNPGLTKYRALKGCLRICP